MTGPKNVTPEQSVWKWNVHAPWEHFSSMVRSDAEARESRSEFHRNHHVRTALYFAIGSLEALLNRMMRAKMQAEGADEATIIDKAKKKIRFFDKVKTWPAEITGTNFILPGNLLKALAEFNELRGKVTHDKKKDHSLYCELDTLVLKGTLVPTIAEAMANLMIANGEEYQYWLHGWNIIGMNGNPEWPICDNNPQFVYAFRSLGFRTEPVLMDADN